MKAWLWDGQAGLDHLTLTDAPDPERVRSLIVCSPLSSCRKPLNVWVMARWERWC